MIEQQDLAQVIPFPTHRTRRPPPRPIWEEIQPQDPDDLMALIAMEVWQRTEAPAWSARFAEAELALVQASDAWRGYLRLETLTNDLADAKTGQAAIVGFYLAAAGQEIEDDDDFDVKKWVALAMEWAGLEPISEGMRLMYEARSREATEKRSQILQERKEGAS